MPIPAQPLPTEWNVERTSGDSDLGAVVIKFQNPFCNGVFFLPYEFVDEFVSVLVDQKNKGVEERPEGDPIKQALHVPQGVILGPGGAPIAVVPNSTEGEEHLRKLREQTEVVGEGTAAPTRPIGTGLAAVPDHPGAHYPDFCSTCGADLRPHDGGELGRHDEGCMSLPENRFPQGQTDDE